VAVTITLPKALHDAVVELAERRECGNVSAVIRTTLYKEVANGTLVLKDEGAARDIMDAAVRTARYSKNSKKTSTELHPEDAGKLVGKLLKGKK